MLQVRASPTWGGGTYKKAVLVSLCRYSTAVGAPH
ncbi:hypothetical protein ATV_gp54 [Bicaudavirus pozzuoliense]|uniref:Uncharacterized protein ORF34 n=1 Tax=Acidianus two-tailed virus TaxID=315953 RepID=Y034_ATV|nr:hypothetical protein ATV_gp54 [Acidianus two-tailed virus]Q3V4R1.1 RecName: Full=Uncharacterized protein ORF34 [Acidianus two-tailed virus]CAI59903.1 hypothetical protein [Acidianus two-tailed virus]